MTPQDELLELIVDTVEKNCSLDSGISLEELPAESGLYAELGHSDQRRGLEELCEISSYLQRLKRYPQGKTFAWLNTETAKEPNKIGRDEDGIWHFSCILNCKIYY